MVCPEGIEPPTTCLEGKCSIQLSYGQKFEAAGVGYTRKKSPSKDELF
jgi:hypothetical protein